MAGYVFAIGSDFDPTQIIKACAEKGVYSTNLASLSPKPFEGTLTDYILMKPGDNIYFFCKRRYYGVGELISVGQDCKYCNYPDSSVLKVQDYSTIRNQLLVDFGKDSPNYRWLCTFKGAPHIFKEGIDTDEILTYKPNTFKMLRAFWKVSFIKLGEEENQSLKEVFLLRRQKEIHNKAERFQVKIATHQSMRRQCLSSYLITPTPMVSKLITERRIRHEMALEAAVVYDLDKNRIPFLGHWDYISHQVIASPFKPIDYMDKIDIFAVRYLPKTKIPCKYLVMELKKDMAGRETIDQALKYVDWVCNEYAYSDYESIEACVIAAGYQAGTKEYYEKVVKRFYTLGSHPVRNKQWNALKLFRYDCNNGIIDYIDETPNS